jgi:transcriptional regulator
VTHYREILRMHSRGISQRSIASTLQCSRNTVSKALKKAPTFYDNGAGLVHYYSNAQNNLGTFIKFILSEKTSSQLEKAEIVMTPSI